MRLPSFPPRRNLFQRGRHAYAELCRWHPERPALAPGGKGEIRPVRGGIMVALPTVDGGEVHYLITPAIRLSFMGQTPGAAGPTIDVARTGRTISAGLNKLARLEQRLRDALPLAAQ
jgi:hypothetical protein